MSKENPKVAWHRYLRNQTVTFKIVKDIFGTKQVKLFYNDGSTTIVSQKQFNETYEVGSRK